MSTIESTGGGSQCEYSRGHIRFISHHILVTGDHIIDIFRLKTEES